VTIEQAKAMRAALEEVRRDYQGLVSIGEVLGELQAGLANTMKAADGLISEMSRHLAEAEQLFRQAEAHALTQALAEED